MPDLRSCYGAALALLIAAPAMSQPLGHAPIERPVVTVIAPAVVQLLDLLHWRLQDHATLPTREHVVCLTGRITPDSTVISDVSAALVSDAGGTWAHYGCPKGAIGSWHNHPTMSIGCAAGISDLRSLRSAEWMRVMLYSCSRGDGVTLFVAFRDDRHAPAVLRYEGQGVPGGPVLGRGAP
jgi:hypothetical protein